MIRLAVMMTIRYSLSLRQVKDLLFERGIATATAAMFSSRSARPPWPNGVSLWFECGIFEPF